MLGPLFLIIALGAWTYGSDTARSRRAVKILATGQNGGPVLPGFLEGK